VGRHGTLKAVLDVAFELPGGDPAFAFALDDPQPVGGERRWSEVAFLADRVLRLGVRADALEGADVDAVVRAPRPVASRLVQSR